MMLGTVRPPATVQLVVLNRLDRFHLVEMVIERVSGLGTLAAYLKQAIRDRLTEHSTTSPNTARTCQATGSTEADNV